MNNKEIGNRIKYVRDLREVTLDDIASKVGVAKSTIQRYESGKIQTLKIPVLQSIAYSLNVNPSWLIGNSEEMEIHQNNPPKIISSYNKLNSIGKLEAEKRVEELTYISKYTDSSNDIVEMPKQDPLISNAAHARTDIQIPEGIDTSENDIMDDINF